MVSELAASALPGNLVEILQPTQDHLLKVGGLDTEISVVTSHRGDSDACLRHTALSSCP